MLAETLGVVIFIGLSLALNRLFEDVDRHRAQQLVALVLVSSALSLVGVVFSGAGFLVFRAAPTSSPSTITLAMRSACFSLGCMGRLSA